jgi:hypothetical protein
MLHNFELRFENEVDPNFSHKIKCIDHLKLIDNTRLKLSDFIISNFGASFTVINNSVKVIKNHMYLATDKRDGKIYWVKFQICGDLGYFKIVSQFVLENRVFNFVPVKGKNINILNKHVYHVYELSTPLLFVPSSNAKIIRGDKKKWSDLCKLVEENENIVAPISRVINVLDLKRFISEFF